MNTPTIRTNGNGRGKDRAVTENAAIIARVSGTGQIDNSSLQAQTERCRTYCAMRGYRVVAERTEAISGAMVLARSEFIDLLDMAAAGQLTVIVVDISDRLGRGDTAAKLELLAQLNGARIEYAQPGRDSSTVEGLVLKSAEQMVSGIERLDIRRRTMGGKREWAKKGRVIASRLRPYGYDYVSTYDGRGRKIDCQLVVRDDGEPETVQRIFEWCAYEGLTLTAIARRLNDAGVPVQRGEHWRPNTLWGILTNSTYKGEWRYGKTKMERHDTPDGVRIKILDSDAPDAIVVPVPVIISTPLWELAQEQLNANHKKFVKPTKRVYLLRGRLRCGLCGRMFIGETTSKSGNEWRYYKCRARQDDYADRCSAGQIRADLAESETWEVIKDAMLDEQRLLTYVRSNREERSRARQVLQGTLAALEAQDQKARRRLDNYIEMRAGGEIDKETYLAKRATIDRELADRETERKQLMERLQEQPIITPEQETELMQLRADIAARMAGPVSVAEKQRLLELLRVEVVYHSERHELVVSGLMGTRHLSLTSSCYGQCSLAFFAVIAVDGNAGRRDLRLTVAQNRADVLEYA